MALLHDRSEASTSSPEIKIMSPEQPTARIHLKRIVSANDPDYKAPRMWEQAVACMPPEEPSRRAI